MKIKVKDEYNLFKRKTFTFEEGLNVLVGENGSGKTTLCNEITEFLKANNIKFIKYDNYTESGSQSKINALINGHYDFASSIWNISEGQTHIANISQFVAKINKTIKSIGDYEKLFIIMDGIDSGVSINKLVEIRELFDIIMEDVIEMNVARNIHKEIYIIVTSNSFELVQNARCVYVKNSFTRTFGTYTAYKNFILKSANSDVEETDKG